MADDNTGTDDGATATDNADGKPQQNGADSTDTGRSADDGLAEAGKRALAEERRARKAAETELAKLRKASMTEQERAVAEAKAAGATEAAKASAPRLIKAELRAAAAEAGLPKDALEGFLEYADLSKFAGDDGEPDGKAIAAAVKRLGGSNGRTNFDGGARGDAARPLDMSALIRSKAGIS